MAFTSFGSLSTLDTLASNFQTVAQYGEDRAYEDFQRLLDHYNRQTNEMMDMFVERTTERFCRYGTAVSMAMEEMDENGAPHPQKVRAGSSVGFPLKSYKGALQWNRKYFTNAKVSEWAAQITALFTADIGNVAMQVKKALFTATNYTWNDYLVDNLGNTGLVGVELPVKALVNADSAEIPVGPNGESFDGSTHTHYLYTASLTDVGLTALVDTVVEHFSGGQPLIYINRAQESTLRALTGTLGQFVPYLDTRIVGETTAKQAPGTPLIPVDIYNRAIGVYRGAEVWVKPWIPSNYQFCWVVGMPRPLRFRERTPGSGTLTLLSEDESHPLRARIYEREFGVGAWNRVNGAVNYSNSGSAYASPSITSVIG